MNFNLGLSERLIYLGIIILAVGAFLWCFLQRGTPEVIEVPVEIPVTVEVPVIVREFDTIYQPKPYKVVEPDKELVEKYNKLKDEKEKLQLFKEQIKERSYKETFEDSIQTIQVTSSVTGFLNSQTVNYETKPREIKTVVRDTFPIKVEPKRSIRLGLEGGVPINAQQINPVFKGNIYFENKKGLMLSAGYDSENRVWAGLVVKLF